MTKVVNFTILTLIWTLVSITPRLSPSFSTGQHTPIQLFEQACGSKVTVGGRKMSKHDFPAMKNDLILRAARGEAVEKAPVWVMRQAGRYLPEFKAVRSHHDFFKICRTPELACEITMQPIRRYEGVIDAAIIFSDILVVPQALGMVVEMREGVGPVFPNPLVEPADIKSLKTPTEALPELQYVFDAITTTRTELAGLVPLLGFTGAPWTLMSYMIEGGGSKTQAKSKRWLYSKPEESHRLLQLITDVSVEYLVQQVKAGAQMLQVFESHAEHLGPDLFMEFCVPYLNQICDRVKASLGNDAVPMTVFAKGGGHHALKALAPSNYNVIGLDWTIDPREARKIVGDDKVLQGNMDPCALYAPKDKIDEIVLKMSKSFGFWGVTADRGGKKGWIANLGHGIYPDVEPTHMKKFLEAIKTHTSS